MGIVNVTPDSFSDGGRYFKPEEAVRRARNLLADGADIIDLGGESTRPGATPLGWEEEWSRLEPVLRELSAPSSSLSSNSNSNLNSNSHSPRICISVDTYHPETAERAIASGAGIINCVSTETAPEMVRIVSAARAEVELVVPASAYDAALGSLPRERLYLDPMIGFGTTREEDLALLRSVGELARRGRVLVGASRKRIVKKLTGEKLTGKNLGGNLGIALWCAANGASVVRVHDVRETVQAIRVWNSLQ